MQGKYWDEHSEFVKLSFTVTRFAECCLYYMNNRITCLYIVRTIVGGALQRCHPHVYMREAQCLLFHLILVLYANTSTIIPNGGCE
jgi:hypothetical protein